MAETSKSSGRDGRFPGPPPRPSSEERRSYTPEERDELIRSVCGTAARREQDRAAAGLSPPEPAPRPESTERFLREAARRVREPRAAP